jgi:hypothetical protein
MISRPGRPKQSASYPSAYPNVDEHQQPAYIVGVVLE